MNVYILDSPFPPIRIIILSFSALFQPVLLDVQMEEHSILEPVHVTVQMATVGIHVKVSTLHTV